MSGTRWIKTKRETVYRRLVDNLDDPEDQSPDHEVYPFSVGYELFTAGLAAGYLEGEQYDGDYDGNGEYYRFARFGQFAENNPEHVACIDLFERLIKLDHQADSEDDESGDSEEEYSSEVTWDDIVAYADKGVGILNGEWNEDQSFNMPNYFSTVEFEVENRLEEFREELTQPPTTGSDGNLTL
jgi:hypothetical protein